MSLVGRDRARSDLEGALARAARVTLVGPAGVGKTALAREVAATLGAPFADLSGAKSADGVLSALAAPLGVRLTDVHDPEEARARIVAVLVARGHAHFVVDNAEHVRDEVAAFVESARDAPLSLLVTSREALFVDDEHVMELAPLESSDAVALLVDRARRALSPEAVDDAFVARAGRVVARIDRLPLAIELVAARLDILTLEQIEARLDDPLSLLRDPKRREARHADLAHAIAWSWDMTGPGERETLRAIATCRDGVALPVLEAMRAERGARGDAVLDELHALRRRHLITTTRDDGETRYHVKETVRAFVESKTRDEGRGDEFVAALARAIVDERRAHARRTPEGVVALAREVSNLARVLDDAAESWPALAARAGLLLHAHFAMHGPPSAHLSVLDRAVRASERASSEPGARALTATLLAWRGDAQRKAGDLAAAARDLARAEALVDDDGARADVRSSMAMLEMIEGDLDRAHALVEEAIARATDGGAKRALSRALERGGSIALVRGEYALVEERCGRALAIAAEADDARSTTNALTYLGIARLDRALHAPARAAFDDARARYAEFDDRWSIAVCDAYLALIALDERRVDEAAALFVRAAHDAKDVGHARLVAFVDGMLAVLHHESRALDRAEEHGRRALALARHVRDLLAACIAAGHLVAILTARGDRAALDEARSLIDDARAFAALLPNPSGRLAVDVLAGLWSRATGDARALTEARARAADVPGVHLRLALRIVDAAVDESARTTSAVTRSDGLAPPTLALRARGRRVHVPERRDARPHASRAVEAHPARARRRARLRRGERRARAHRRGVAGREGLHRRGHGPRLQRGEEPAADGARRSPRHARRRLRARADAGRRRVARTRVLRSLDVRRSHARGAARGDRCARRVAARSSVSTWSAIARRATVSRSSSESTRRKTRSTTSAESPWRRAQ